MGFLLTPAYQPFAIAACVLIGLVVIEAASLLIGASLSEIVDSVLGAKEAPLDGSGGSGLDWLNVGRVPLLILLIVGLAAFAIIGFLLQGSASAIAAPLPPLAASLGSVILSVPVVRGSSRLVSRLLPRDETYAVGDDHFIGRTGIVTVGPVQAGVVARIKLQDQWGNWHFPRARPARPDDELPVGTVVLVVDRVGREFAVIRAQDNLINERASA
jgi:membrane protein implicated in regulation of membrane protease activity